MLALSPNSKLLVALALALLVTATGAAQESFLQDITGRGYVGFTYDLDKSGNTSASGYTAEVTTDFQGALINPDFISFGSSFTYGRSSSSMNGTTLSGSNTFAGSATVMLLPSTVYPLTINYQRVRAGLGQSGFAATTNSDRLGIEWRLKLERLPKLIARYSRDGSSSEVPVASFVPTDTHGSSFGVSATDTWKGWEWEAGWSRSSSESATLFVDTLARFKQGYDILGANVSRRYWGEKGNLYYSFARTATDSVLGETSVVEGTQMSHAVSAVLQLTSKLRSNGSFSYYTFNSDGRVTDPADPGGPVRVITFPSKGYAASGSLNYQLHPRITVSDTVQLSHSITPPVPREQTTRYFSNLPTVIGNYRWRGVRMTGTYGFGYRATGTTFGKWYGSLSQTLGASAAWSHPWVALGGGFGISHATEGILPGAYTDNTHFSFTADTSKVPWVKTLRFRWNLIDRTLLGTVGYVESRRKSWSVAAIRRRFQVEVGKSSGAGAHQAFEVPSLPFQPLPELVGVPLVDDDNSNFFVSGTVTLRPNLQVRGTLRKDATQIRATGGRADYNLYELHADYRIGRILVNATYGHYVNVSDNGASRWDAGANRLRFRVVRTFNLF